MRNALLPYIAWLGALQSWGLPGGKLDDLARLVGVAGVLGTLTVLIYRLGIWRQEMENTRNNVGAQVKAHREGMLFTLTLRSGMIGLIAMLFSGYNVATGLAALSAVITWV